VVPVGIPATYLGGQIAKMDFEVHGGLQQGDVYIAATHPKYHSRQMLQDVFLIISTIY
jgi:hypothetical protein